MNPIACKGNKVQGICKIHPGLGLQQGTITEGNELVTLDNIPVAVVGNQVRLGCSHIGYILEENSSVNFTIEGVRVALVGTKIGDGQISSGQITEGSEIASTD